MRPWTDEKCNEATDCDSTHICLSSAGIMVAGLVCFYVLQWAGEKLISTNDEIEKAAGWSPDIPRELSIEKVGPQCCCTAHASISGHAKWKTRRALTTPSLPPRS